jgi:RPA family protein
MPVENILDNIFGFMDIDHIQPSEIKKLAWWEYEAYVKRLNDRIERDNKQQKEQNQQNMPDYSNKMPNMNSIMNNLGKYKK